MYMVWQQQKAGEAELARAEQNRQVAVLEAKAKLDSAESLAQAEVKRAEGTAKANQIIGQSLKGNEAYIHWLWVDTLKDSNYWHIAIICSDCIMFGLLICFANIEVFYKFDFLMDVW